MKHLGSSISILKRLFTPTNPQTLPNPLRASSKPSQSAIFSRHFGATVSREAPKEEGKGDCEESEEAKIRRRRPLKKPSQSWLQRKHDLPVQLKDVICTDYREDRRINLAAGFGVDIEVTRVLGGGLVPGSVVLFCGDPGIGKSTLVLQIAGAIAQGSEPDEAAPILYVSGEESIEQIGSRANRLNISAEKLFLYSDTNVEDIEQKAWDLKPRALIIDSIQTVYSNNVIGSAGGLVQVTKCALALTRFAKATNIPVILIGHVSKTGDIAGPRELEHIVDVILFIEGEKNTLYRMLRALKNRYGSTDELGVFKMTQAGLKAVLNPSEMFLSNEYLDSVILAGFAVAVVMDRSRTFLLEIQALYVSDFSYPVTFNGIKESRAYMLIAVLAKQARLPLNVVAIFLNVVSGRTLTDTAGDLAIAAAICSSLFQIPIPNDVLFIGEIGLGGELRKVPRIDKRMISVAKLGYKKCFIPKSAKDLIPFTASKEMEVIECRDLKEFINKLFPALRN